MVTDWPDPPAASVWAERVRDGVILAAAPESEPGRAFDRYVRFEIIADLAVYHLAESD